METVNRSWLIIRVTLMLQALFAVMFTAIFVSAGTLNYTEGWVFFSIFDFAATFISYYFIIKDPSLVMRRTKGEKDKMQQIIQSINGLMFLALIIIPGLDYRYEWSQVPVIMEYLSFNAVILGFLLTFVVLSQNRYAASNISVEEGQPVVTTGIYSLIRHPLYSAGFLIIPFTSLALGSFLGLIPGLIICVLIVVRAIREEKILSRDLKGYEEYLKKVRFRFIPLIW